MYAVYYWPFSSPAQTTSKPKVGWFAEWDKKRTIPVEQLREILKAQGSPWAKELADTVEAIEPPKAPKHRKVIREVVEEVFERAADPVDWGPVIASIQAAQAATRTTLAIKHAEAALAALRAAEDDDEEAITLLMDWI